MLNWMSGQPHLWLIMHDFLGGGAKLVCHQQFAVPLVPPPLNLNNLRGRTCYTVFTFLQVLFQ